MSDEDARPRFPYMSPNQLVTLRARFKQSVPSVVSVEWIIAALDSTEKTARNVFPQLKLLGLIDNEGRPTDLVFDLKDDETFAKACGEMVQQAYPDTLRQSYEDSTADPIRVAGWFGRNAKTGEAVAALQARTYLWLLKAELPAGEDKPAKRRSAKPKPTKKTADVESTAVTSANAPVSEVIHAAAPNDSVFPAAPSGGPNLHIDVQVHVAADASAEQIDAIFASMAKHLYGR